MKKRCIIQSFILTLFFWVAWACGDATAKLPGPSLAVVQQCQSIAEHIAACSNGTLTASPNDGSACGTVIADGGSQCAAAFDNFAACVTGNPCPSLSQGSCRIDYSATTGYCGGFLSPKAQPYIGIALPN